MGYSTEFKGEFKFSRELLSSELMEIKKFFGEDCREHPEWKRVGDYFYYINLKFNDDFSGIRWDGSEKTGDLTDYINLIIDNVDIKDFLLTGKMLAQGEDIDDRYEIHIENGRAVKKSIVPIGKKTTCPHCEEDFYYED